MGYDTWKSTNPADEWLGPEADNDEDNFLAQIVTHNDPKPIPDRQFDWSAVTRLRPRPPRRLRPHRGRGDQRSHHAARGGAAMKIGSPVLWHKTINRYGHTRVVRVIVREVGERVTVEMIGKGGKIRLFNVQPERLREVSR